MERQILKQNRMEIEVMKTTDFFTVTEIAELKTLIKSGDINTNDIKLLVKADLISAVGTLRNSLYAAELINSLYGADNVSIISRKAIKDIASRFNIPMWKIGTAVEEGYLSICGSGYIFDITLKALSEDEHSRLDYLTFEKGLIA
jgi:hypothetical protein